LREVEDPGVLATLSGFQQCAAAGLLHVITMGGDGQDVETLTLRSGRHLFEVSLLQNDVLAHD
jgi:hypothetical protein